MSKTIINNKHNSLQIKDTSGLKEELVEVV